MSALTGALKQVGVDLGVDAGANLIGAITDYNKQNLSPGDLSLANAGLRVLAQATGIGALVPGVVQRGVAGEFESVHYADDLNAHHPKFKFLFKVQFEGFPGGNFSYFIHRCDKPKVRFNHTDVNFYNFRTKVLTSTSYDPLTFTFLDEIGNTVNSFFANYVKQRSRQGNGKASILGGDQYSSTVPYDNGYSAGKTVKIQQIFANGLATNIFTLINARIDSMEFDELNMEQTAGSMFTCTVSYDAISCETTGSNKINSWGNTDIYAAGGTSGSPNAGSSSTSLPPSTSAIGGGIGGDTAFISGISQQSPGDAIRQVSDGLSSLKIPDSLKDLANHTVQLHSNLLPLASTKVAIGSNGDVLSSAVQGTLDAITSGKNLQFGGRLENWGDVTSTKYND